MLTKIYSNYTEIHKVNDVFPLPCLSLLLAFPTVAENSPINKYLYTVVEIFLWYRFLEVE